LLLRRGLRLEYATLAWNVFGSGLVLAAAVAARSVALAGFGLDGLIEIAASAVVSGSSRAATRRAKRRRCV
jgi:divalent metal cation (Fe/Co/Zn/Cd) transporter